MGPGFSWSHNSFRSVPDCDPDNFLRADPLDKSDQLENSGRDVPDNAPLQSGENGPEGEKDQAGGGMDLDHEPGPHHSSVVHGSFGSI